MTEDTSRTVTLLWDDHVGGMNNVSLPFAGVSTATAGHYSAVWYTINATMTMCVRDNANVTRVYLEQSVTDSVGRVSVNETDIAPPAQPAVANAAYSIWSLNITNILFEFTPYDIGFEIDGVSFSSSPPSVNFPPCAE
ncbi:hypothetical protein K438DRAFT_1777003 [Mycena galopus ATCC 62051]|nr:hypothetical protein K438DRAFT_1777003 [Mycena galopus ATCC 62051]